MEKSTQEKELATMPVTVTIGDQIGVGLGAIHASEAVLARQEELAEAAERHIVAVDPSLPCGCIDGRPCLRTLNGEPTQPRATVAGGIVTPYAAAEIVGWFGSDISNDPIERLEELDTFLEAAAIPMGNHVDQAHDDASYDDGTTGCGASDKLLQNISNLYEHSEGVQGFVRALHGDQYNDRLASDLRPRDEVLAANQAWNPVAAMNLLGGRDGTSIEVLASNEQGVYGHREFSVIFNYLENTTIDRDAFVAETDEQVFVVDLWYIDKLARAMARGPQAEEQYVALRQAMVGYQIGTYLSLCDGSQTYMTVQQAV